MAQCLYGNRLGARDVILHPGFLSFSAIVREINVGLFWGHQHPYTVVTPSGSAARSSVGRGSLDCRSERGFSMEMAIALLPLHQDDRLCTREQIMLPVRGRCRARIIMSDGRNCGHPIAFSRLAILANATPSVALRWEDRIRTDFSGRGFFFPSYVYRLKAMTKSNTTLHLWPTPTFADQHNLILSGIAA